MAARTPPRNVEIKGQEHMLAYITPAEGELLKAHGGSGEPGPMGIPAFADTGGPAGGSPGSGPGDPDGGGTEGEGPSFLVESTYRPGYYWHQSQRGEDGEIVYVRIGSKQDTTQARKYASMDNPNWNQGLKDYTESKVEKPYDVRLAEFYEVSKSKTSAETGTTDETGTEAVDETGSTQFGVSSSGISSETGSLSFDVEGILNSFQQDAQAVKATSISNYGETGFIPQQEALTKQDYTSKFVDFGSQYYGLKGLGDWTSIGVDPELTLPVDGETTTPSDDDRGDGGDEGMDTLSSLIGGLDTPGLGAGVSFGLDAVDFDVAGMTYAESLTSLGLTDLVGSVGADILGPALSGNFGDISFKDAFGFSAESLKDSIESVFKKENWTVDNIAKKGLGVAFSAMPMGSMLGGIINGEIVKNAFGHDSLRPSGPLGMITDALHYTQFNDMAAIKAAHQAISFGVTPSSYQDMSPGASVEGLAGGFTGNINDYDVGFALDFGMGGITRAPGSRTYSGNMRGLSHEQVKALEAISKGYTYAGYIMNDGTGKASGTTIASAGGLQIDPSNPFAGYISAKGNPVNALGQGSYYATMDQVNAIASTYGVSPAAVTTALNNARNKQGTFQENITAEIEANLSTIAQSQKAGTYTPGTTTGFVGTPEGGAPGSGIEQTGITGWAGSGDYGDVTAGGAAFGPGTPGYSSSYDEDDLGNAPTTSSDPYADVVETIDQALDKLADIDFNDPPAYDDPYANESDFGAGDFGGNDFGGFDDTNEDDAEAEGDFAFSQGGKVPGYAMGTPPAGVQASQSGFIDRPPSQVSEAGKVADDRPMKAKEGTFIINAAAVEFAGEKDIRKMIMDAQKEAVRRGLSTEDFERHSNLIDIAVSSGEVTIAPHLVKIIGEDRLEKINKRGIRKTEQRIAQNGQQPVQAARGGFLA